MASLEGGFNAMAPENNVSNVIPKGDYQAVLVNSKLEKTKDQRGSRLSLDFQICGGEFQNKHVFENLNIFLRRHEFNSKAEWEASLNADEKTKTAVNIARGRLSALCRAVGKTDGEVQDSAELHNKVLTISVDIQEAQNGFPAKNKITAFKPRSAGQAMVPPAPVPPITQHGETPATNSETNGSSPW